MRNSTDGLVTFMYAKREKISCNLFVLNVNEFASVRIPRMHCTGPGSLFALC